MRLVLAILSLAGAVGAQSQQANLSGIVTDPQGAVIVNAEVAAVHEGTGVRSVTRTNASGFYAHRFLPIGKYRLTCEANGFRRQIREGIALTTGLDLELNIQLEIGATAESVTVTDAPPLLETRNATSGQLIENRTIEDIPLGDRRSLNIVRLLGGAVVVTTGREPQVSLAGGRAGSFMFQMDGGTGQNMRLGSGQVEMNPPVEGMEEMKVLANNYSAEYGASSSGVLVVNTKSGTNRIKGALFEYLRNEKLDAATFFAPVVNGRADKAPLRYNVFGGAVGGPIRKNRTFYFVSYEGARRSLGLVRTYTVPTDLQKAGDFSRTTSAAGAVVPIYDPASTRTEGTRVVRDAFPGNRIPAARLDPVAVRMLAYYPVANRQADTLAGANNFRANAVNRAPRENVLIKVDENLGSKDKLTGRFIHTSDDETFTSAYPTPEADTQADPVRNLQFWHGAWTRILSPTLVNDFRFTYEDRFFHSRPKGLAGNWVDKLGLKGVPNHAFPSIAATGFVGLGNSNQREQFPIRQHQFNNNLSWIRGRHAFKFGGEARRGSNFEVVTATSGSFGFTPLATGLPGLAASGNGLASLLVGFPTSFSARRTPEIDRYTWYLAGFAQDDWTVHKDLTINLGVRWETDTPTVDKNGLLNFFDTTAINPVSGTPGVVRFAGQDGLPNRTFHGDWNNFGPRLGFAWKPRGSEKTVIRTGVGVFYSHPGVSTVNTASLGFEQSIALNSPDNGVTAPFFLRDGVPGFSLSEPVRNASFGAVRLGQNPNTAVTFFEQDRRSGYSIQYNFGLQRELPGRMVAEAAYVGSVSRKQANGNLTLNQIPPALLRTGASQRDRPFPQFSNVTILNPGLASGSYNSMLLRLERRLAGGLLLQASYTWAKLLNDYSDSAVGDESATYSDFYNRRADWGPDGNDIRHRLTWSSVWELPFGKGKRFLADHPARWIAGGWSLGALFFAQTGAPFTVTAQVNSTNAFSAGPLRADVLRNPAVSSRTLDRWFDTEAFRQPAPFAFGNQGVNILRGDGKISTDLSLIRSFYFTETIRLQFRAEFLNATNHPDFGLPGRSLGGPGFGVVSSSDSPRSIQLGLRMTF